MSILDTINRASELIDEGIGLFQKTKTEVNDAGAAVNETDLNSAKQRLAASIQRAQAAHDELNAAINARLAQGGAPEQP